LREFDGLFDHVAIAQAGLEALLEGVLFAALLDLLLRLLELELACLLLLPAFRLVVIMTRG
jgi:hypothetical protein